MTVKRERVLVLGGYGLIGSAIVRALAKEGFTVIAVGRDVAHGRRLFPEATWIGADISRLTRPADWSGMLENVDVVVNASGALQTGLKDNLTNLQELSIKALIEASEKSGVRRFVQISAPGADQSANTEFLATKGRADETLRDSSLEWFIMKPGLVISTDAYGGTALLRMLAAFPLVIPVVKEHSPVGTASVEDVVEAVKLACAGLVEARTEMDIVEEHPYSLAEVLFLFRRWLGFGPPMAIVRLPSAVGTVVAKGADFLGRLGWRSPLRTSAMKAIDTGILGDTTAFVTSVGRSPKTLEETLAGLPSTVQERWFARMFLAMPAVIGMLSLFWLTSGIIGAAMWQEAASHLTRAGLEEGQAKTIVFGGAVADIALGLGVLVRPYTGIACLGMAALTAGYLGAGTLISPELWADPIGPYVKTIPAAMLALVGAAISRTR